MLKNTKSVDKESFLFKAAQLEQAFKLEAYEYSGVYPSSIPPALRISDRLHLSEGSTIESYKIFGQLLLKVPFLIKIVGRYLKTYHNDMMIVNAPGIAQPKIIAANYDDIDHEQKQYIYTSVQGHNFKYEFPTDTDVEQMNEFRKQEYINIICIIWLINLLRSNYPSYKRVGFLRKEVVPRSSAVISSYRDLQTTLENRYGKESAAIITRVVFELMQINQHEFLAGVVES